MGNGELVLLAGGDVAPVIQPVDLLAELVLPTLEKADFRFMQCERTYSHRGTFPHWVTIPKGEWSRLDPEYATVFRTAKADVISVASNHAMDWGYEPLEDTIELFRSWGAQVIGAGPNQTEAHRPAIIEKDGIKVAILAYCSVLRDGQTSIGDHPGIAGIRANTWYEPVDFQPGCPPLIHSQALEEDVAALREDIAAAKKLAQTVIVSLHWGLRYIPKVLAEYQTPLAHAAIDAGADLIIGHHPHQIKAVEVYKGKVCFYSVGNFLTTGGHSSKSHSEWNLFWYEVDETSNFKFPPECREMVLPKITFTKDGVQSVKMLPGFINKKAQPEILTAGTERFDAVYDKLEWVSSEFPHTFSVSGNEIEVAVGA